MVGRLRVARLDPSDHEPLAPGMAATPELHRRLTAVIRRHLPPVTASLLTLPQPTADGRFIEWYSDLAGQPVPLPDLPEPEQAAARALLRERVASVRDLANRLPSLDPEAADLAQPLRQSLSYPGEDTVYVVGGQPVLTFWGYASSAPPAAPAGLPPPPLVPKAPTRGGLPWWLWLLLAALLAAALAIGAWWYYRDRLCPPWSDCQGRYDAALADRARLEDRVRDLEAALRDRLDRCGLQDNLAAARRDEAALLQRLVALQAELAQAMQLCPLKRQVSEARAEGEALQARMGDAEARLAEKLEQCRREAARAEDDARRRAAEEAARVAEEKRLAAEEQRRKTEEAQRQAAPSAPDEFDTRRQSAGGQTGELTVTLIWNNVDDVDLHVVCPTGAHIFFDNRSGCGGRLDVDMNARNRMTGQPEGPVTRQPVENVFWRGGAPPGSYKVVVDLWRQAAMFGGSRAPFRVKVQKGDKVQYFDGAVSTINRQQSFTFTYP